jgi:hypothetical protein
VGRYRNRSGIWAFTFTIPRGLKGRETVAVFDRILSTWERTWERMR